VCLRFCGNVVHTVSCKPLRCFEDRHRARRRKNHDAVKSDNGCLRLDARGARRYPSFGTSLSPKLWFPRRHTDSCAFPRSPLAVFRCLLQPATRAEVFLLRGWWSALSLSPIPLAVSCRQPTLTGHQFPLGTTSSTCRGNVANEQRTVIRKSVPIPCRFSGTWRFTK